MLSGIQIGPDRSIRQQVVISRHRRGRPALLSIQEPSFCDESDQPVCRGGQNLDHAGMGQLIRGWAESPVALVWEVMISR